MKIQLDMSESDIVRSMKNKKHSPIQVLASRNFKEDINNVEVNYDSIILWDDSLNDYQSFNYCVEDIESIKLFIDEWSDYVDGHVSDFTLDPMSFCVEQNS
jgi:hypothetical protein